MPSLSILTFNILAPCYKRLPRTSSSPTSTSPRESEHPSLYTSRLSQILTLLSSISPSPDVIALQEVWFHPPFLTSLTKTLSPTFHIFLAQRPNKSDGLALLIRKSSPVLSPTSPPCHLKTFPLSNSDRVGLAVVLTLYTGLPLLLINAHLTFPHNCALRKTRALQADSLIDFVKHTAHENAIIVGDFNGDGQSTACQHLMKAGFTNCWAEVNGSDVYPKTHFNHRKQQVFVDHVFLKVPPLPLVDKSPLPLEPPQSHSCPSPPALLKRQRQSPKSPTGAHQRKSRMELAQPLPSGRSESPSPVGIRDIGRARRTNHPDPAKNPCAVLKPVTAVVYPDDVTTDSWPVAFQVSDHRPLGVTLSF